MSAFDHPFRGNHASTQGQLPIVNTHADRGQSQSVKRPRRAFRLLAAAPVSTLIATAVALPGLMLTQPASAAVTVGTNISAFPNRDMVVAVGYEPGEELTVEVVRNGVVIGTTTGPAVTTPEGVGLEVNHGPLGAPLPGDCWTGVTPDIIGGDVIRVTNAVGAVDTMTVKA
ncbi:MAG TPA: hypothetical protein VFP89_06410, partial [Propionibacteriaceae bacterium]|nr:hypothetical protein [Propionibacteriaceae bacterium]